MVSRRALLGSAASALAVTTAGCSIITGSESLEFVAKPVSVTDEALSGTGYAEAEIRDLTVSRTFSAADQERTVEVTNRLARYERQVDLPALSEQRTAVFVVLSSPEVELFGRTFNPIGRMSTRELLETLQSSYSGLDVGDRVGEHAATMLGQDATIEKYDGSATVAGATIGVFLHIVQVEHDEDYVVAVAIYPNQLGGEDDTVVRLIEGIEHGE